jgi:aryl-alcohol dehydrogenase-like predicted oxidoreductase
MQEGSHAMELPRLILDYLQAHPHAADSAEGIRRWWLGARGAATAPDEIERALAQLVRQGLMRQVGLADGTQLYARGLD